MKYHFVKANSDTAQFRWEDSYFELILVGYLYTRSNEGNRGAGMRRPLVFVNRWLFLCRLRWIFWLPTILIYDWLFEVE
jgi:hypothetical protein